MKVQLAVPEVFVVEVYAAQWFGWSSRFEE
jgi:hypothetical protein